MDYRITLLAAIFVWLRRRFSGQWDTKVTEETPAPTEDLKPCRTGSYTYRWLGFRQPKKPIPPNKDEVDWSQVMLSADCGTYIYRDKRQKCHWVWQDRRWKHSVEEFTDWGPYSAEFRKTKEYRKICEDEGVKLDGTNNG